MSYQPFPTLNQGDVVATAAGFMAQAAVNADPPSYVTGYIQPLSLNYEGRLRVALKDSAVDFFTAEDEWGIDSTWEEVKW